MLPPQNVASVCRMISCTAIIFPHVKLGKDCIVEDYAIIGALPAGTGEEDLETIIGDNAHIRTHTVIYAGNRIGNNFQTGNKANVRELNEIGDNVSIGTMSVIEHHVRIGHGVRIHSHVFVAEYSILEKECWIGPGVVITNAKYPKSPGAKEMLEGAHIKENAIVGANCTLLPSVVIGKHALIGAGSVIAKDVPAGDVMVGNPAKRIKTISSLPYSTRDEWE